ncbi:adenylosuccinate lyase family protein [Salinigranum sp.]|uniref:class-II fumarase/aspartase family protein n=1 Tax=Salinigranum sp. TaxID=1966351 RepID=UPI00356A54DE
MPTHLDGSLFADVYGTPEARAVFSQEGFVASFLRVEAALARAQAEVGLVPSHAAETIVDGAARDAVGASDIERHTAPGKIFSVAVLEAWLETLPESAARYVHWGVTTQDVSDTAVVLQLREWLDAVLSDLDALGDRLVELAERHRDTAAVGRTNHVHATPTTWGLRFASWLDELSRRVTRLRAVREEVTVVQCFGATGTLASLGEDGLAVQEALADRLGLAVPAVAWFAARDRFAALTSAVATAAGTLARVAKQVLLCNRPEVGEVTEPVPADAVGSSTMPHKRNPLRSQVAVAMAHRIRARAAEMHARQSGYDERDYATWVGEFGLLPEVCLAFGRQARAVREVLDGLTVDESVAERNLEHHGGLVASERVMMALADRVGKEAAHRVVHEAATEAVEGNDDFVSVLSADDRVTDHLSDEEIRALTDPTAYTGLAGRLVDRAVASVDR